MIGDGLVVRSLAVTYPDGAMLGEHNHPWSQLVYGRSGVMRVTTPGASWLVPPTKAIWLPAHRPHDIQMRGAVALRTLYLSPEIVSDLPAEAVALEVAPLLAELTLHILKIGMLDPSQPSHVRLAGVLVDLIRDARHEDLFLPLPSDRRAAALAEQLQANPQAHSDLGSLARAAGSSLRTLQRLFPRETGLSLEAWRHKARMIHAVARLAAGVPVTAAALDCGYESTSAFISAFRRQFGATPRRYRLA